MTTLKFFQMVKLSKDTTNKCSWSRMLTQSKLTDSNKYKNQWCNHKCQPHRMSLSTRLPKRTSSQCKIPKPSQEPPSQRFHWRPRKRNKKRRRPPNSLQRVLRMQPQAKPSSSSQSKYLSPTSHLRSELLTLRGSNNRYLVRSKISIIFKTTK